MSMIFGIVLLLASGSAASASESSMVDDHELSLGGIAIDDTEASVIGKVGQPRRATDTRDFLNVEMEYAGLTVWLGEGRRVGEVLSTSAQFCTPSGVCPGMSFARAIEILGPPVVAEREDGQFMEYPSSQSSCWLQIAVNQGTIASVRAECQP